MLKLKRVLITVVLLMSVSVAFAQQAKGDGLYDLSKKMQEVESANHKLPYLKSFLDDVSKNPAKYCAASQQLRDSTNHHMQLDFNVVLLVVFKNSEKDKNVKKIMQCTSKAYEIGMQMIFAGEFLSTRQKKLDAYIADINLLVEKTKFDGPK